MAFARVCISFALACFAATAIRAKPMNEQLILDDGKNLNFIELASTPMESNDNMQLSNIPQSLSNKPPAETGIFPNINIAFKKLNPSEEMADNPSSIDMGRNNQMYQSVYEEVALSDDKVEKPENVKEQSEDESIITDNQPLNQLVKEFVSKNIRQTENDDVIDSSLGLMKVSEPKVTYVETKKSECYCKNNNDHNNKVSDVNEDVKVNIREDIIVDVKEDVKEEVKENTPNVFISADVTIIGSGDQKMQSLKQLTLDRINEHLKMRERADQKEFIRMIEKRLLEMEAERLETLISLL